MTDLTEVQDKLALANYLVARVVSVATGSAEPECLYNSPHDRYFIGNLRPAVPADDDEPDEVEVDLEDGANHEEPLDEANNGLFELRQKIAPVAFGADFLLDGELRETTVGVTLKWSCYYRVFPTLDEQRAYQIAQGDDLAPGPDAGAVREAAREGDLCPKFRKIDCLAEAVITVRRGGSGYEVDESAIVTAAEAALRDATRTARCAQDRFRTDGAPEERVRIREIALRDEPTYSAFLEALTCEIPLDWKWGITAQCTAVGPHDALLTLQFGNESRMPSDSQNAEGFFFNTSAQLQFAADMVRPFTLPFVPESFRYDAHMWGSGFNCAVEQSSESPFHFHLSHVPIYRQKRYVTRQSPPAPFDSLAADPVQVLSAVRDAMSDYQQRWLIVGAEYRTRPSWSEREELEFTNDQQSFDNEIERFERGVALIESDPDIRRAFQLMNQTFALGEKTHWRLFQLVFIVSQIPGIAALDERHAAHVDERSIVDIIYFPTGGGKTEAYLGTVVFHAFYDRLRGKAWGPTAWTRFPLRLLTLQQTQRAAEAICMADLVRRRDPDPRLNGPNVSEFAVGYFVGAGGSPNEIQRPSQRFPNADADVTWAIANDPDERQRWLRVPICPSCRTDSVVVDFDAHSMRLLHRCTNNDCGFREGVLPVYVVDNEIYRYLPTLVVGTIDKLASLGTQRKQAALFGATSGYCPMHGFFIGECFQDKSFCERRRDWTSAQLSVPTGVTLFVQDELHLLKEGLGTFDSHYETFAQRLRREFGHQDALKIIASSATIEAFERQVEHLYGRLRAQARLFPNKGPTNEESFYAETLEYAQRIFVGILPHNKTILNSVLELLETYHREVMALERSSDLDGNPFGGSNPACTSEYYDIVDLYRTTLSYFSGKRQLNEINTDIEGDVAGSLMRDGLPPLEISELSGGTQTDEVTRILARLERPSERGSPQDAVLATSMVSHGVDIDRLNAMIFFGMPRLTAEYIQASSRVGRTHVGIVFNCLHPVRERDRSHYRYFIKYHEFLGELVEPAAINRWSRFGVRRTLPGLFMGVLLQILSNRGVERPGRFYKLDYIVQQVQSNTITPEDFVDILKEAYGVADTSDPVLLEFSEEIEVMVRRFLYDQIAAAASSETWVSNALRPPPMRSLRDIDVPISIELDTEGSEWARRARRGGGNA